MSSITPAEFASHVGSDSRTVRKFLRSITPREEQPGKGARWSLDGSKRSLSTMKKNFDKWNAAQLEERAARAAEKAAEAAAEVEELDDEETEPVSLVKS